MIDHETEAAAVRDIVIGVLKVAAMRRAFGGDEYRPPLPIHGSARWHDRRPLAETRNHLEPLEMNYVQRQTMEPHGLIFRLPAFNNEDGD